MTTKRKPVKKAAKKVVKKTLTMKELDRMIQDLYARNDNRSQEIIGIGYRQDKDIAEFNERIRAFDKDIYSLNTYRFMYGSRLDEHDKFYNEIRDMKQSIWWTRFWLAITVIAFVIYAIIAG